MAPSSHTKAETAAPNFVPVRSIIEGEHKPWAFVNVIGLVVDIQEPRPTAGTDWKSTMRIYDKSVEDSNDDSLIVNLFLPKDSMPRAKCGDLVVFLRLKVQQRNFDGFSLITNRESGIYTFTADKIPRPPGDASPAFDASASKVKRALSKPELEYISKSFHTTDKSRVPTAQEFEVRQVQSLNGHDKFSQLKDLRDGKFYDLIVHIVRFYDAGDKVTVWVSDFTENPSFYNHQISSQSLKRFQEGDPYGYTAKFDTKTEKETAWDGPFGKRCLQITCYEPHATAMRDNPELAKDKWVTLKNVQIKYGHNAANLEGFLRGDRYYGETRLNILPLDPFDKDDMDPRLKQAIGLKRDYEKSRKSDMKGIQEAAAAGVKRKAATLPEDNSKSRRRQQRAREQAAQEAAQEAPEAPIVHQAEEIQVSTQTPNLNPHIKCENHTKPISSVTDMLGQLFFEGPIENEAVKIPIPFVNLNYRADVRVTNFLPLELQQFAVPKKISEYDVLSDHEGSESSSGSDDGEAAPDSCNWEWRFALELEDAAPNSKQKERIWVLVDNQSAQCLVNLDATNLSQDTETLETLRQRMFLLWGDLEERKQATMSKARRLRAANGPPPDSSDNEEASKGLTNRPFSCCIRQYGIKIRESDPSKTNAGKDKRYERVFGLYGTRIIGD